MQNASIDPSLSDPGALARRTMVDCQIKTFDVTDAAVLERMMEIPRERFLPRELAPLAYSDASLQLKPAREGARTLLPPLILARLLQAARIEPADKVLVVAANGGYAAALIAGLAHEVVAVESDDGLYEELAANLKAAELSNVRTLLVPLVAGAPAQAPFDLVFIDGAVEARLQPLLSQLKDGGRLVTILRLEDGTTKAVRYDKADGATGYRILFDAPAPTLEAFRREEEFVFS